MSFICPASISWARPRRQSPTRAFYIGRYDHAADNPTETHTEQLPQFAGFIHIPA
jgi:hypothetical protein